MIRAFVSFNLFLCTALLCGCLQRAYFISFHWPHSPLTESNTHCVTIQCLPHIDQNLSRNWNPTQEHTPKFPWNQTDVITSLMLWQWRIHSAYTVANWQRLYSADSIKWIYYSYVYIHVCTSKLQTAKQCEAYVSSECLCAVCTFISHMLGFSTVNIIMLRTN